MNENLRSSRNILAYNEDGYSRLQNSHVLICGLNPVGTEVLKSLLLSGINNITIYDTEFINETDTCANPFLTNAEIGQNRADVTIDLLQHFNTHCALNKIKRFPNGEQIRDYDVLVYTLQDDFSTISEINELCRNSKVGFILADSYSYSGLIFNDFGENYLVERITLKKPRKYKIGSITKGNPGKIYLLGSENENFQKIKVKFYGLTSMTELNGQVVEIERKYGNLYIGDTSSYSEFNPNIPEGFAEEILDQQEVHHKAYKNCLDSSLNTEYLNNRNAGIREMFLKRQNDKERSAFYKTAPSVFVGAFAANECIKYITRSMIPLTQWFVFNNSALFDFQSGKTTEVSLKDEEVVIVGVGAVGCEVARMLAKDSPKAMHLIDPDDVELSNLSRQLLFRESDVTKNKAEAAKSALNFQYPSMNITAHAKYLNKDSIRSFPEELFTNSSVFFGLVDSFGARDFISQIAAQYRKPFFTGGISPSLVDFTVSIPDINAKYISGGQSTTNEKACTLRLYPHTAMHCVQWAVDQLNEILNEDPLRTAEECIEFAKTFFLKAFDYQIRLQLHEHPPDQMKGGQLFWTPPRIMPVVIPFDPCDKYCTEVVAAVAKIAAANSGIDLDYKPIEVIESNWDYESRIETSSGNEIKNTFDSVNEIQIDFIESCANLRARNYRLMDIPRLRALQLAAKIEPTVTTTSAMCGSLIVMSYLSSKVDANKAYTGCVYAARGTAMFSSAAIPRTYSIKDSNERISEWETIDISSDTLLTEGRKLIEDKIGKKLMSWATYMGEFLKMPGTFFGKKLNPSDTFDDLLKPLLKDGEMLHTTTIIGVVDEDVEENMPPSYCVPLIIHPK